MAETYDNFEKTPYKGPFVYLCATCKKYYDTGGCCPCCEDIKYKPIPLRKMPVSDKIYRQMLFGAEIFTH